jgi:hypothetical protein
MQHHLRGFRIGHFYWFLWVVETKMLNYRRLSSALVQGYIHPSDSFDRFPYSGVPEVLDPYKNSVQTAQNLCCAFEAIRMLRVHLHRRDKIVRVPSRSMLVDAEHQLCASTAQKMSKSMT